MQHPQLDLRHDVVEAGQTPRTSVHQAAHLAKGDRRPSDSIWRANPREQGLLGLTDAIAHFGDRGWSISLPLIDSQPYDLVVDGGRRLQRVQVKTTRYRSTYGIFVVNLATRGGNRSFHTSKPFVPTAAELLYVLTDGGDRYVVRLGHRDEDDAPSRDPDGRLPSRPAPGALRFAAGAVAAYPPAAPSDSGSWWDVRAAKGSRL